MYPINKLHLVLDRPRTIYKVNTDLKTAIVIQMGIRDEGEFSVFFNSILLTLVCSLYLQDMANSLSVEELSEKLSLHKLCCGRSWNILGSDAHSGGGLHEGLDWMARQLMSEFAS